MRHLSFRDIDWPLLLITMVICGVGVLQIYSATMETDYHGAWWKQILYVLGGLFLMWLILAFDYHALLHYVPMLFIASVVALLGTYIIGESAFGSRRWIPLGGGLHLQVSEFVKLDSAGRRASLTGIGIRQAGDNIVGSPLSDRIEDGRVRYSGNGDSVVAGCGAHVSGDQAARPWDGPDVCGCSDRGRVCCGVALEVYCRHRSGGGFGASVREPFPEGLSEGAIDGF